MTLPSSLISDEIRLDKWGFDLAHFALTWHYPVRAGWECRRYSMECLKRPIFSINKLILKLSPPSGGRPYDFSICSEGRLDGQGLFSTISQQKECTFLKYAPLLHHALLCKIICSTAVITNLGFLILRGSSAVWRGVAQLIWNNINYDKITKSHLKTCSNKGGLKSSKQNS